MDKFIIRSRKRTINDAQEVSHTEPNTSTSTITNKFQGENKKKSISVPLPTNLNVEKSISNVCSEPVLSESSVSDENDAASTKKRTKRVRTFRYQWIDEFNWVENKKGSAYCKVCDTRITNIRSHLVRHNTNATHEKNMEAAKTIPINEYFTNPVKVSLDKQVKEAELMLVMFCIMHHLPFAIMDYLPNLLLKCCPDSKVAANIKCGRTKANSIARNVLGQHGRQNVVDQLRIQKFSLIIDETTDVSSAKALAVVARVFDKERGLIRDRFLGLLKLIKTDAASIYSTIVDYIQLLNIPLDNIIGLGSDNASVMSGQFTGVQARLKEVLPNLFFMNCICHSLHLCASNACQKLPYSTEQLARNIFNFFAHSAKRCNDFQAFQEYLSVKPHKIVGLAQTRWLSLEAVVNRILEQWDALQLYFVSCTLEDKGARDTAKNLAEQLSDPINRIYVLFLSYTLRIVNKMNAEFQSEQVRIHMILETMENNYKLILSNFVNPTYMRSVENVQEIDFYKEDNHLNLSNISMGSATDTFLTTTNISHDELLIVSANAKKFYIELAQQIKNRFDFNKPVFKYFSLINPEMLVSENVNLIPLLNYFPNLISDNIERDQILDEFKLLKISSHLSYLDKTNVEEFWLKVGLLKNSLGEPIYNNISSFMMNLMCLPHSSAAAERIFSDLNHTKGKKTNRLLIETVDSMMAAKELLTPDERKLLSSNKACEVWAPRSEHKLF